MSKFFDLASKIEAQGIAEREIARKKEEQTENSSERNSSFLLILTGAILGVLATKIVEYVLN